MFAVRSAARITSAGFSLALALGVLSSSLHAQNGGAGLRDAITRRREARQEQRLDDGADEIGRSSVPPNLRVGRDVA